jgi:hypothetical protein
MKKITFWIILVAILFIASCTKPATPGAVTGHQSSWTLKGVTYTGDSAAIIQPALVAYVNGSGYSGGPVHQIAVFFPDQTSFPVDSGTYIVTDGTNMDQYSGGHVSLLIENETSQSISNYGSTGFGANQTVHISVAGGKMTIKGTGIMMKTSSSNGGDSATVDFIIHQYP